MSELWTDAEIAFLIANQLAPTESIMPMFPDRTLNAVNRQRTKLGVGPLQPPVTGQRWDADEIAVLHQYRHLSSPKLIGFLPGRSHLAIEMKRRELGIPYEDVRNGWTQEEIEILRANAGASEAQLMDLIPNRSGASIMNKAYRLGLARRPSKKAKPEPSKALKSAGEQAKKRAEMARPAPVQPPQPGEITHRQIDGRKIAVLWGDDGVPMVMPKCWEPSRDGMFSALYRRTESSLAVVQLALPTA